LLNGFNCGEETFNKIASEYGFKLETLRETKVNDSKW
jgi:hypothetical protein